MNEEIQAGLDKVGAAFEAFQATHKKNYDAMGRRLDEFEKIAARPGFGGAVVDSPMLLGRVRNSRYSPPDFRFGPWYIVNSLTSPPPRTRFSEPNIVTRI